MASVLSTEITMASQRGTPRRSNQVKAGQSRAVTRIATNSGITMTLSWMTSHTTIATAAAMTIRRQAYAAARRSACGTAGLRSLETVRSRITSTSRRRRDSGVSFTRQV